ncbi:MAG: MotA/TolQ/ExbB proton channel family protein [Acidobacteria bacterium]|nr:MotA/TolQ/ExbB proton channel family protein [Acidobacteriota bacterium]
MLQLVYQSGLVAKIVLVILLGFSVLSWGIILNKWLTFRKVNEQSQRFYAIFKKSERLADVYTAADSFPLSPLAGVFKGGYEELHQQIRANQSIERGPVQAINERIRIPSSLPVQRALQKASTAEMTSLEGSLSWLATTGAVTPFIGLFGTVVGIINAFQGLGSSATTTIQAVAPGISEALVATAAGLFAAIPAVVAYNQFVQRLRIYGAEIDDFSMEFLNWVERNFAVSAPS